MDKRKKTLIIGGIVEGVILVFALILSIIVLVTVHSEEDLKAAIAADPTIPYDLQQFNVSTNGPFIAFFQNNPIVFFLVICLPIFLIIAVDFIYLALTAYKRESKLSNEQLAAIKKKAEAEVRDEVLKELLAEEMGEKAKDEEKPAEEAKPEEPKVEEKPAEEPAAEEPKAEEKPAEEPAAEEPKEEK